MRFFIVGIFAALLGILNARFIFVGSAVSLIPWGILGLFVGWLGRDRKEAVLSGIVYGFILSFIFMVSGYNGIRPLLNVVPFFVLLGLFGALCGAVLGIVGNFVKKFIREK